MAGLSPYLFPSFPVLIRCPSFLCFLCLSFSYMVLLVDPYHKCDTLRAGFKLVTLRPCFGLLFSRPIVTFFALLFLLFVPSLETLYSFIHWLNVTP